jgi:hypothetical protein
MEESVYIILYVDTSKRYSSRMKGGLDATRVFLERRVNLIRSRIIRHGQV